MNPSKRLYAAISGENTDRVPVVPKIWVDLAANLTGTRLVDVFTDPLAVLTVVVDAGLDIGVDAVRQFQFPRRKIEISEGDVFEVDSRGKRIGFIDMNGGLITHLYNGEDYRFQDPRTMAFHHYWSFDEPLLKSLDDAKSIAVPDGRLFDQLGWSETQSEACRRAGDSLALIGDCSSATLAFYVCLQGMDRAMYDLIERPELVHAAMEKGVEIAVAKGKYWLDYGIKILRLNDSVANMSVISPEHWREFVFPHMRDVVNELHSYDPKARIYCHICGNILPIAEDLVETGLDCIGPLDPLGGFTPAQIRQKVGDRASLMGGVNTLSFCDSTPEEVKEEAIRCIRESDPSKGYVLGSGCVIPRSAKRENLIALVKASRETGDKKTGGNA